MTETSLVMRVGRTSATLAFRFQTPLSHRPKRRRLPDSSSKRARIPCTESHEPGTVTALRLIVGLPSAVGSRVGIDAYIDAQLLWRVTGGALRFEVLAS